MTRSTRQEFEMILRKDFLTFITKAFYALNPGIEFEDNWHIWAMVHYLNLCRSGEINRLLITLPPRSLKSHIVSICFPAFILGHAPSARIICASYSQILAEEFSNKTRILMSQPWYQSAFPKAALSSHKNTASEFSTIEMGHRIATSPGGTLTGRGGMYIIVDDINKATDAISIANRDSTNSWFDNTLQSRLDNMNEGCIIVVQQRVHDGDLAGHVLDKDGWVHLNLPAVAQETLHIPIGDDHIHTFKSGQPLHPKRYNQKVLDQIKQDIGSYNYAAQYIQEPIPEQGNLIPIRHFKYFSVPPTRQPDDLILNVWDTASGQSENNDYSVGTIWLYRRNRFYLLDVIRRRMAYDELRNEAGKQAISSEANLILIEKAGVGIALIEDLRKLYPINIIEVVPKLDKITRMIPGTADIEAGKLNLPKDAPWLADFEKECASFPKGKHDDQVDCLSMLLNWARERQSTELSNRNLNLALETLAQPAAPPGVNTKDEIKSLFWPGV